MKAPTRKHKPIVSVDDYNKIDGKYAGLNTDAQALSLGKAQYDNKEISAKVWRKVHGRWSRESEELPLHRNLDLSILFIKTLIKGYNRQSISNTNEDKTLTIHEANGEIQDIMTYYEANKHILEPRLKELKKLLEEWL